MTGNKPLLPWPGADDKVVVEEMLRDFTSGQWFECREYVRKHVDWKAGNILCDQRDDLVQNIMIRIYKALPGFKFGCRLKTWLYNIIQHSIIDVYRMQRREGQHILSLGEPCEEGMHEEEVPGAKVYFTPEDNYIVRNELLHALLLLDEYIQAHANCERNRQILEIVLLEAKSLEEAAIAVGCSAPVAGYIVRSAQRYVRERMRCRC